MRKMGCLKIVSCNLPDTKYIEEDASLWHTDRARVQASLAHAGVSLAS